MNYLRRILARLRRITNSELDHLIPPEIRGDPLYDAIIRIASTPGVRHILEIGSSAGAGSTEAFVTGALRNQPLPFLYCMEVSKVRYDALVERYTAHDFVRCYHLSSVPIEEFPSPTDVERFYRSVDSKLRAVPLEEVLRWLRQDVEYLKAHGLSTPGIRIIKQENEIERFDAVLIDGSEFTGRAELNEVYGARFILLDDTCNFKNHENVRTLSKDPSYRLVEMSERVRNGYAVFERRS